MSHLNRLYCCSCREASLICRHFRESQSTNSLNRATLQSEARWAMFHLDYLSCFLTILATILLARKSWVGLFIAIVNSLIVCAIALRTSQLGFIPANLFCICIYAFSMRSWVKKQTHTNRDQAQARDSGSVADGARMRPAIQNCTATGTTQKAPKVSFVHIH